MFRIRESFAGGKTVHLRIDGRLSDRDLKHIQDLIEKYLDQHLRVYIIMSDLTHLGLEVKRFFQKKRDRVTLIDLPEHLKTEILKGEENSYWEEE